MWEATGSCTSTAGQGDDVVQQHDLHQFAQGMQPVQKPRGSGGFESVLRPAGAGLRAYPVHLLIQGHELGSDK